MLSHATTSMSLQARFTELHRIKKDIYIYIYKEMKQSNISNTKSINESIYVPCKIQIRGEDE